jgi:hypothetical protein
MEKLEDQLMSASGKLQRGMRWPVKIRKGPFMLGKRWSIYLDTLQCGRRL